jgi:ketosteroid isomerase-like protein
VIVRLLFGTGEAVAFPVATRAMSAGHGLPHRRRGPHGQTDARRRNRGAVETIEELGTMDVKVLLSELCTAAEQKDGARFASQFCERGVYHDVFYGPFEGRARIAAMIEDWFYKAASDLRWDMHDPVCDGRTLYARYIFSFRSLLPEAKGARAMFEGVAIMRLQDGKIAEYREVANAATGFIDMNFAPERIAKILARQGGELKSRPELARHLA